MRGSSGNSSGGGGGGVWEGWEKRVGGGTVSSLLSELHGFGRGMV